MLLEGFRKITAQNRWNVFIHSLLSTEKYSQETINQFEVHWIEAGHRIREQVSDDQLLINLLRQILPPYKGTSLRLYRGENKLRWNLGDVGFSWSSNIDVAKMFARGLNSSPGGGLLLVGDFKAEAIISGVSSHSSYLGEDQYTIDPFYGNSVSILEEYKPIN